MPYVAVIGATEKVVVENAAWGSEEVMAMAKQETNVIALYVPARLSFSVNA
jgi:hypothetical protein